MRTHDHHRSSPHMAFPDFHAHTTIPHTPGFSCTFPTVSVYRGTHVRPRFTAARRFQCRLWTDGRQIVFHPFAVGCALPFCDNLTSLVLPPLPVIRYPTTFTPHSPLQTCGFVPRARRAHRSLGSPLNGGPSAWCFVTRLALCTTVLRPFERWVLTIQNRHLVHFMLRKTANDAEYTTCTPATPPPHGEDGSWRFPGGCQRDYTPTWAIPDSGLLATCYGGRDNSLTSPTNIGYCGRGWNTHHCCALR